MQKKLLLTMALAGWISGLRCPAQVSAWDAQYATNHPNDFAPYTNEQYPWLKGKYVWNGKSDLYWRDGVWKDMTNGLRVVMYVKHTNWPGAVVIGLGTAVTNFEWVPLYKAPYNKFAKFELVDPEGKIVQPKPDAGTNLLKYETEGIESESNAPAWASPTNSSLVVDFPESALDKDFPRYTPLSPHDIYGDISFSFITGPDRICTFELGDLYTITKEGDYTLTVQPVVFSRKTDDFVMHRVILPSLTAKIHLVPNAKP